MDNKLRVIPLLIALAACDIARADGQRVEGGFDRSVTVSGPVDLEIRSGSGRVDVRSGETNRIHVVARIVANDRWSRSGSRLSPEERVRRLEAHPPIEQSGPRIRIGVIDDEDLQNVSISYTVTVPAETALVARNGSGSVEIEGLGRTVEAHTGSGSIRIRDAGSDVTAETGSGSIRAERIGGAFRGHTGSGSIDGVDIKGAVTVHTGSGGIDVSQSGGGDVTASSSSGSMNLTGIRGGVNAKTSSGTVRVEGEQTGEWRLSSSSGGGLHRPRRPAGLRPRRTLEFGRHRPGVSRDSQREARQAHGPRTGERRGAAPPRPHFVWRHSHQVAATR